MGQETTIGYYEFSSQVCAGLNRTGSQQEIRKQRMRSILSIGSFIHSSQQLRAYQEPSTIPSIGVAPADHSDKTPAFIKLPFSLMRQKTNRQNTAIGKTRGGRGKARRAGTWHRRQETGSQDGTAHQRVQPRSHRKTVFLPKGMSPEYFSQIPIQ